MSSCVNLPPDTSVSHQFPDFGQPVLRFRLRLLPVYQFPSHLSLEAADLYSNLLYEAEDLGSWHPIEATCSAVAQLKVAELVEVRVEG